MKHIWFVCILKLILLCDDPCKAMGPPSPNLWNFSIESDINETFTSKLSPEEKDLAFKIFAGDTTVKGSLEWVATTFKKHLTNEKSCTGAEAFLLFQYPSDRFPADYNEGIALSNVEYVFEEGKGQGHPEWVSIGRLKSQTPEVQNPLAEFVIRRVVGLGHNQLIITIREKFIWQNKNWSLIKNECFIFAVNAKLTDECQNNLKSDKTKDKAL